MVALRVNVKDAMIMLCIKDREIARESNLFLLAYERYRKMCNGKERKVDEQWKRKWKVQWIIILWERLSSKANENLELLSFEDILIWIDYSFDTTL